MKSLKFLHISDTHFCVHYNGALDRWGVDYDPAAIFENFIAEYDFSSFDFIVHTGDLIHNGNLEDYKMFKWLMDKYIPKDVPVYYCLGNHDKKRLFHTVFCGKENTNKPYVHEAMIKGYRLLFLDSSSEEIHDGIITSEQEEWVKEKLNTSSGNGTLIFHHHPLFISWMEGIEQTKVSDSYISLLQDSDVKGIFTGHLHMNRFYQVGRVPQFTGNSFVFGITREGNELWNTNRLGYSVVEIKDGSIDVFNEMTYPTIKKLNQNIL